MKRFSVLLCLGVLACGRGTQNTDTTTTTSTSQANLELKNAAPDVSALTIDEDAAASAGPARDANGPPPSIAAHVKVAAQDLNAALKAVLGQIDAMIATEPQSPGVWVLEKNGLSYRLTIAKGEVAEFKWKLEAKKIADAEYTRVMAGKIKRKGTDIAPRHGAGVIGIDLTAYKAIAEGTDAAITKDGKIFAAFHRGPAGRHVVYRLRDFRRDTTSAALPISVYFSAFRLPANDPVPPLQFVRAGGRFNVSEFADLAGVENEIVTGRLRRVVGHGGWARALIRGGNLPEGTRRIVRECWNSPLTGTESLYLREVWDCTGTRDAATGTYPTCTQKSEVRYPAAAMAPAGDPDAPATKQRFLAECFPDAAARLKDRLKQLAANEAPLPEDPNEAEASDETPVQADDAQDMSSPVETSDANAVDAADDLTDVE